MDEFLKLHQEGNTILMPPRERFKRAMEEYAQSYAQQLKSNSEEKWISVEDKLPESGKPILAYWTNSMGKGRISKAFYAAKYSVIYEADGDESDGGDYNTENEEYYFPVGWHETSWEIEYTAGLTNVTHWQPLPSHPLKK